MNKYLLAMLLLLFGGCTENVRARQWGGKMSVCTDPGDKLVNITWKEGGDLWLLVRKAEFNEEPQDYEFQEVSSFGQMNGTVKIHERPAGSTEKCR